MRHYISENAIYSLRNISHTWCMRKLLWGSVDGGPIKTLRKVRVE